jgi:hypothetical protein
VRQWLPRVPLAFLSALVTMVIAAPAPFMAQAAERDGLRVPDTLQVNGKTLYLNGFGRRTYPVLGLHIYVASLYLERTSSSPEEVIRSPQTKLLAVRFERDVSAEDARSTWRKNIERACVAPCHLDPADVEKFITSVPAMHEGDVFHLTFRPNMASVTVNGQQLGSIPSEQFAEVILASFLGPNTDLPKLKQDLLTGHTSSVTEVAQFRRPDEHQ